MLDLIARRAFFQFELPIHYWPNPPRFDGNLRKWPDHCRVPDLMTLEGEAPFARVWWAWNEEYFLAAFAVTKRGPLEIDPEQWWKKDGIRLCLDTRDARDLKRATRFCHFFYFLPAGGPRRGLPRVGLHKMAKAKEHPPPCDLSRIKLGLRVERGGYQLEAAIPTAILNGFDPVEHPRIGVYYKVRDAQGRSQHLASTDELGWNADPSTWATGVLLR